MRPTLARTRIMALALVAAASSGCVDPAPFIPEGTAASSDGSTSGGGLDVPEAVPEAVDDLLCLDPAAMPALALAAPGLLANDTPTMGLQVEPDELTTLLGGTVVLAADGSLQYQPPPGVWGTDAFAYSVIDAFGRRAGATARVDVRPTAAALARVAAGELGLLLEGQAVGERAGTRATGLGDVNGDGVPDLGVGAHYAGYAGTVAGRSYVVLGRAEPAALVLPQLSATQAGYALDGEAPRDVSGWALAAAGDFDGNGLDDVLIGAPWVDGAPCPAAPFFDEGCTQGRAYVAYGQEDTTSRSLSEVADGLAGFALDGIEAQWFTGSSVASVSDLDGDGLPEVLVGSPAELDGVGGFAHLVRGSALVGTRGLGTVGDTTPGFVMSGAGDPGQRLAAVGDVDGDGLEDLAIADHDANDGTGVVHVVFGKPDDAPVDLDTLATSGMGFTITGASTGDRTGTSLAGLGDVNGDGLGDLAIGAPGPDTWDWPAGAPARAGRVYVVLGKSSAAPVSLVDVDGGQGGLVLRGEPESAAGHALASVTDWNGDGLRDLLVGAPAFSANGAQAGRVYVVQLGSVDAAVAIELADVAAGHGGMAIDGQAPWDQLGYAVGDAGDLDGDGLHELMLGAPGHGANTLNHGLGIGRAYVLPGIPLPSAGAACDGT